MVLSVLNNVGAAEIVAKKKGFRVTSTQQTVADQVKKQGC